jgi:hypothetical protein
MTYLWSYHTLWKQEEWHGDAFDALAIKITSSVQLQKLHPEWATSAGKTSRRKSTVILLDP